MEEFIIPRPHLLQSFVDFAVKLRHQHTVTVQHFLVLLEKSTLLKEVFKSENNRVLFLHADVRQHVLEIEATVIEDKIQYRQLVEKESA